ncbi:MAG: DUF3987 domain-containing protein [Proteobacteria bacterium]|nr:MAG: DUF3987 domain-containing protein [Pseudomonadota bacterium]
MKDFVSTPLIAQIKEKLKPSRLAVHLGFKIKNNMINCPYHEDASPSMSCFDDKGLFHCFSASCEKSEKSIDVIEFYCDQKTLSFSDALEDLKELCGFSVALTPSRYKSKGFSQIANIRDFYRKKHQRYNLMEDYIWQDLEGVDLKAVFRFQLSEGQEGKRKEFPQAFFYGGKWFTSKPFNLRDPAPYRWHEVKDSEEIFILEGEKDVETALKFGLKATTTGSSSSWKKDYAYLFQGKRVVIIPDNDPPGRKYAEAISKDLADIAQSVTTLCLLSLEGDDFTDWVNRGGTPEALGELLKRSTPDAEDWPEPSCKLSDFERIPPFEADEMLPESARYWLEYIAEDLQCPLDALGAAFLSGVSVAIGKKLLLQPKRNNSSYRVAPVMWFLLVADSGQKKTHILREALGPLFDIEDRIEEENCSTLKDVAVILKSLNIHEHQMDLRLSEAVKAKDQALISSIEADRRSLMDQKEELAELGKKHLVLRNVSPEKALEILVDNPNGAMIFSDEISGWWRSLEKGYVDSRQQYLQLHGGHKIDLMLKSYQLRGESIVSIVGGVQGDWLKPIVEDMKNGGRENDGLLNRFGLLINHDERLESFHFSDRMVNPEEGKIYNRIFDRAYELQTEEFTGNPTQKALLFSDEAYALYRSWSTENGNNLIDKEFPKPLRSQFAKYDSLFCSLSLVFHVVLTFEGVSENTREVSLLAAELAQRWCRHLSFHAHKTYTGKGYYPSELRAFAKHILSGKITDGITRREIQIQGLSHLRTSEKIDKSALALEKLGIIRIKLKRDGSKMPFYQINPKSLREVQ